MTGVGGGAGTGVGAIALYSSCYLFISLKNYLPGIYKLNVCTMCTNFK